MKFLLGLSFFLLFAEFFAQPDSNYFQQEVNYEIHVALNDELHQLDGKETIWYKNNSKKTLNYIYFHLWPNAYKDHKTALTKQLLEENNTMLYFSHDKHLGFIDG